MNMKKYWNGEIDLTWSLLSGSTIIACFFIVSQNAVSRCYIPRPQVSHLYIMTHLYYKV